ncbi:MAG TPA: hypothetical protein VHU18_08720 [Rhizomicrobium sp.]|nr:hypothetical protein [Rhizomicrobium sp.]
MRYLPLIAAALSIAAVPAFAQSTPETASPPTPAIAPITGTSTVAQPGTPMTPRRASVRRIRHYVRHHVTHPHRIYRHPL